jgi:competence ComEA-like helix-hairpin-helix protein
MRFILAAIAFALLAPLMPAQGPATPAGSPGDFSGLLGDLGVATQTRRPIPGLLELNLPPFGLESTLAVGPVPSDQLSEIDTVFRPAESNTPEPTASEEELLDRNWTLNINTASVGLLSTAPLIDALRAEAIVQFRESNGPFRTPSEIREVFGITEATFISLSDHLICQGETTLMAAARRSAGAPAATTR